MALPISKTAYSRTSGTSVLIGGHSKMITARESVLATSNSGNGRRKHNHRIVVNLATSVQT